MYIPLQGSPFYKNQKLTGIELLEHCFLSLQINLSDFHFILGGEFNSCYCERLDCVKEDTSIPEFQEYLDIFPGIPLGSLVIELFQNIGFFVVYSMLILNCCCGGDLNGSFSYISAQGCSLIDYVLVPLSITIRIGF